ncbi:MAG: imidazole glycerol phosphate synthase subunit HisH [bacterium]
MISIVDYGMGNLRSVQKAIHRLGYRAPIVNEPSAISDSRILVLPGVGAFDRAVKNLKNRGLWSAVMGHLADEKPYLGICLGLQLLFESSEEGSESGFSVCRGRVVRFKNARIIPHMGWNDVSWNNETEKLLRSPVSEPCYYFVHSYFPCPEDKSIVAGVSDYGGRFCCAIKDGNRYGVQFHPEKSQFAGLTLLKKILGKLSKSSAKSSRSPGG